MNVAELTPELSNLVNAARLLPSELVRQVTDFAEFLGKRGSGLPLEVSDEWSEDDLHHATLESLRRFEAEHPNDDWGMGETNSGGHGCSPPAT